MKQHFIITYDYQNPSRFALYRVTEDGYKFFVVGGRTIAGMFDHCYNHYIERGIF